MKCRDWFIDADTHITEPGDVWTSRLPRKFQDAAPRMVRTDDGVDVWQFGRRERKIPVGATAVAGWPEPFPSIPRNLDECPPAAYDARARLAYMDEIGAWLDWLKKQRAEKVALLGHSRGGNQTARFAATMPDPVVTAVILIAPQTWSADYAAADYEKRYGKPLAPVLARAQKLVDAGKGDTSMDPVDFVYCEQTSATAAAFVSYYANDPDMDTPRVIPGIGVPVLVVAGSEDTAVKGLPEKVGPLADGERVRLLVVDGADHFFRDLYSEDIADAVAELLGVN